MPTREIFRDILFLSSGLVITGPKSSRLFATSNRYDPPHRPCCSPSTRYIFGSGGDSPNVLTAASRLAVSAARGSAPPPEPGVLEFLCRDRERRASVAIDRLSFVTSPNGFLTAARAATSLEAAAKAARNFESGEEGALREPKPVALVSRSAPLPLRPSVSTSLHVQVGELWSMLSLESRPLASLNVTGLAFEASRKEWWDLDNIHNGGAFQPAKRKIPTDGDLVDTPSSAFGLRYPRVAMETARERSRPTTGWPGWTWTKGRNRTALGYLRVCLQSLGVLDLTTDGQLHSEVVCHATAADTPAPSAPVSAATTGGPDRRTSAARNSRAYETTAARSATSTAAVADPELPPVIIVELIPASPTGSGGGEVNVSVIGLRVCFLRRFMAEVARYFGPDGLGPVFAVAQSIGGGSCGVTGGNVESGAENDEEKVAANVNSAERDATPDGRGVSNSKKINRLGRSHVVGSGPREQAGQIPTSQKVSGPGGGGGGVESKGGTPLGMRITAVLEDLIVVVPRSTHSREAAAVKCEELILEVSSTAATQFAAVVVVVAEPILCGKEICLF